ncbi:MAG: VOC family protein [Actinomycetota bacterium]|nr:VOC family protein [Actinomycetota bacterium]
MSADGDSTSPRHSLRPQTARWTHLALRVADIAASISWYERHTPLRLLERREDDQGYGAWLGQPESAPSPFILVLAHFFPATDPFAGVPTDVLAPFSHIGIELPARGDVDAASARADVDGCLVMAPQQLPDPVGYVCMARDPDGNLVEFSFDQGVYETARRIWGDAATSD